MKRILDPRKIRAVYDLALRVAEETGIRCDDARFRAALMERAPVRMRGGRLLFPRGVLDGFFAKRREELAAQCAGERAVTLGGHWHSWELCDPICNIPRPATEREAVDMAKLSESLGARGSPIPVAPSGLDPRRHTLECERLALLHTGSLGGSLTVTDREEVRVLADMNLAAGRRYRLAVEPLISPLTLNGESLGVFLDWNGCPDLDIAVFGAIPMAGATAPLAFPASLAQILAEAIVLDYVFSVLSDGRLQSFSLRLEPFDMRCGNIVFGSAEWCVLKQMVVELWEGLVGVKPFAGSFRTNGRNVDAQTLTERTASFLWQVELGLRRFSAVGQICIDEVYSPVQAVIDLDLTRYANRLLRGIDGLWDETADSVGIIGEGLSEGGYLAHDSTLSHLRTFHDPDRLGTSVNLAAWKALGSPPMQAEAWAEARRRIASHEFELDADRRRAVMDAYRRGCAIAS